MDDSIEASTVKKSFQLHEDLLKLCNELTGLAGKTIEETISIGDSYETSKLVFSGLINKINEFEPCPKLLDQHLTDYIENLSSLYLRLSSSKKKDITFLTNGIGQVVYNLSKIRGFKNITNYFSSDVYLVPTLLSFMEVLTNDNEIFLCLIWLSNLVLVPFQLSKIEPNLISKLYQVGLTNLSKHFNASKNQLVSLILLSRLLTRVDVLPIGLLHDYIHMKALPEWAHVDRINGSIKLGHLITINKILKRVSIEEELDTIYMMLSTDLVNLRFQQENNTSELNNLNVLYVIKILSHLSTIYIKSEQYDKVTSIINNLMNDIFKIMTNKFDTSLRYALAKAMSLLTKRLSEVAENYQEQLILYMIGELEIPNIWKGNADNENGSTTLSSFNLHLTIDNGKISIPKYHTILLYLGYICLNKSLTPRLIPTVLSITHKTLFIEQQRLSAILGGQVRDSSCFILWALCRMIDQSHFEKLLKIDFIMENVLFDLLLCTIMDSELIIRRCGVAVIQEFIGRFGGLIFKQYSSNDEELGSFIIRFIELFSSQLISSNVQSYELIESLIDLGFNKNLFLPLMVKQMQTDVRVKLNAQYTRNILNRPEIGNNDFRISKEPLKTYTAIETIHSLLKNNVLLLLPICELLYVEYTEEIIDTIRRRLIGFKFDFHFDSVETAVGYMKWVNFKVTECASQCKVADTATKGDDAEMWEIIFSILRIQSTPDLTHEFQQFFNSISNINTDNLTKFIYYLNNNNTILSNAIFYYKNIDIHDLVPIISNTTLDSDMRSNLINCLSENYSSFEVDLKTRVNIISLLDDYTITNQGDVGSKIRFSAIKLIARNLASFIKEAKLLQLKLIRLSGELIDKIRFISFKLLNEINGDTVIVDQLSFKDYFHTLFKYYQNKILSKDDKQELSIQFWKGISFTIGASIANPMILNDSFEELLRFLGSLLETDQELICQNILTLLKVPPKVTPRDSKSYTMILSLLVKLFESNYAFPSKFSYKALYIRCYNLQINTSNVARIGLTLKLMLYLSFIEDLRAQARKRLIHMALNHKLESVRRLCGDVLFEVVNEIGKEDNSDARSLEEIEWSRKDLGEYTTKLEWMLR